MATPLPILFYLALSALLISSCPGAARLASPNYRQVRDWWLQMFRGSEYRLNLIGAFAASSIAGEQLARDASAEPCLLEVAGRSGTPSVISIFGASLLCKSSRAVFLCMSSVRRDISTLPGRRPVENFLLLSK
jgi:hypothetical protein